MGLYIITKLFWILLIVIVANLLMQYIFPLRLAREYEDYAVKLELQAEQQFNKGLTTGLEKLYEKAKEYRKKANDVRIGHLIVGVIAFIIIIVVLIN
jgi:hypothetical protein